MHYVVVCGDVVKLPSPTLPINACVMLIYAVPILMSPLSIYVIFAKTISREGGMSIKVLHQEKGYGSKKLLAEFPNTE